SWKMEGINAASALEAMKALRDDFFHLVIINKRSPSIDGMALARAIKADPVTARTKILLLTPLGQHPDDAEIKEIGIDACLTSPIRRARLFECFASLLNLETARTESEKQPPEAPRNLQILLAEDGLVNRAVAEALLRKLGHTAEVVVNG